MFGLKDKTILILSPQSWGKMFVSKHHYALQLAREGNRVYFINPPVDKNPIPDKNIVIQPMEEAPGLFLIHHKLNFPYNIKFHFIWLFHALMRPHIQRMLKEIGRPVDIVWSFDLGNLYPFRLFPGKALRIFHPVDEPLNQTAIDSARGGQVIFSVTREILDKYKSLPMPGYFINHGIAASFLQPVNIHKAAGKPVRVGLSGNFLRSDIDRLTLLRIVNENPGVQFECWGSYSTEQSNLAGDNNEDTLRFIGQLRAAPNVVLHGVVPPSALAAEIHRVDAFLICYDIKKDQSGGTNYHKIMEYISTGKVIISNNVTTYKDKPELISMTESRQNNDDLPLLFKEVINNLEHHNSPQLQTLRVDFAKDNTYDNQIRRIEEILQTICG